MKKFALLVVGLTLLFATNNSFAQNNADSVIKNAVTALRNHQNCELSFSYHYETNPTSGDIKKFQGSAWLQGDAYKIVMEDQQTISDGTTIWSYLVEDEEVMVSDASEGSDNTPLKLLTTLDKDYTATLSGTDEGLAVIELSNPKGDYKRITVKLDIKKNELCEAKVYADDGSSISLTDMKWKYDQDLKDGFFTFDEKANPNVEIIDMR